MTDLLASYMGLIGKAPVQVHVRPESELAPEVYSDHEPKQDIVPVAAPVVLPENEKVNPGVLHATMDFLKAGKARFTVDNGKGTHFTFQVKANKKDKNVFFVSLLTGPDNTKDYTYMGLWRVGKPLHFGGKTTYTAESVPAKTFAWALKAIEGKVTVPAGYSIQHSGQCGKCLRELTDPVSIASGLGPICRDKLGLAY